MTTTNQSAITPAEARELAAFVEQTGHDLLSGDPNLFSPLEASAKIVFEDVEHFRLSLIFPDTTIPAGDSPAESAEAIASQVEDWSTKLKAVAEAIRERYAAG